MKRRQIGFIRRWVGRLCQDLAWRLTNPHDSWMIDYRNADGHACAEVSTGHYNSARAVARELGGKIVGWRVTGVKDD